MHYLLQGEPSKSRPLSVGRHRREPWASPRADVVRGPEQQRRELEAESRSFEAGR